MPEGNNKLEFLDLVIPLCLVYGAFICGYAYFTTHEIDGSVESVAVMFFCSFFFTYGVICFFRDLQMFGLLWVIRKIRNFGKINE